MDDSELPPRIHNIESLVWPKAVTDSRYLQDLTMEEDVSLLRQPMKAAKNGFLGAQKAFENGTDEIRRLLIHECSLIYECKVCRNMFRSLVNFISHKRIYCKLSSEGSNYRSHSDQNSTFIKQARQEEQSIKEFWLNKSRSTGSSPVPPTKTSTWHLSKVVERLKRLSVCNDRNATDKQTQKEEQQTETFKVSDAAAALSAAALEDESPHKTDEMLENTAFVITQTPHHLEIPNPVLQLESVPTLTQALHQTLNPLHATDSIRTEVEGFDNILLQNQQNTMVGPDGNAISALDYNMARDAPMLTALLRDSTAPQSSVGEVAPIVCKSCGLSFQTEKILNIHIKKKHNQTKYVFECPVCTLTFLQPAAGIRHLANEHKNPLKRKMRELMLKKRMLVGDVQIKSASGELRRPRMDASKDLLKNGNGSRSHTPRCSHCHMVFEKRSAFYTHMTKCPPKNYKSTNKLNRCHASAQGEGQNELCATTTDNDKMEPNETKLHNQNSNISKALVVDNQNTPQHKTDLKNFDQASKMMMMSVNQENKTKIKTFDCEYLTQALGKVNIKQEPQEEEFNSSSTQATTGSDINEMFENLEKQTFGEGLQVVSLDLMVAKEKMEDVEDTEEADKLNIFCMHEEEQEAEESIAQNQLDCINEDKVKPSSVDAEHNSQTCEQPLTPLNSDKRKQKGFRTVPAGSQLTCRCKICNKEFNALSNLRRHISMFHYRSRRFGCILCDYRAFRRYDIVNHLSYIHKMQGEREAMALEYVTMHEVLYSKDDMDQDIVLVEDVDKTSKTQENVIKTYVNKTKRKVENEAIEEETTASNMDVNSPSHITLSKVVRKRIRKSLTLIEDTSTATTDGGPRRPIRNCIKHVDNDFVYDLKEESQDIVTRLVPKKRITLGMEIKNKPNMPATEELTPPIKITPYRLRTESLIPANKETVKGSAAKCYRQAICSALAAPSTLPEMPAGRPQMRPRLTMAFRSDSSSTPVIEATKLEVARLKSTFFDDSFLEKFAKNSNPSFKMKPALLALNHQSPLNSILQKFENNSAKTLNNSNNEEKLQENGLESSFQNTPITPTTPAGLETPNLACPPESSLDLINPLETSIHTSSNGNIQYEVSPPSGNYIMTPSSPPSRPRKRITLMQRLAENRAKRCDFLTTSALDN